MRLPRTHLETAQRAASAGHGEASGRHGIARVPPRYGIDLVDRIREPASPPAGTKGLPDPLRTGVEHLSGVAMDDVQVHDNSPEPARLQALAYTRGTEIHVGPGQEHHLPHEAWHAVQQKQGRVGPTTQLQGQPVNASSALEREADVMGARAARGGMLPSRPALEPGRAGAGAASNAPIQCQRGLAKGTKVRAKSLHGLVNGTIVEVLEGGSSYIVKTVYGTETLKERFVSKLEPIKRKLPPKLDQEHEVEVDEPESKALEEFREYLLETSALTMIDDPDQSALRGLEKSFAVQVIDVTKLATNDKARIAKLSGNIEKTLVLKMNEYAITPADQPYDVSTGGFGGCTLLLAYCEKDMIIAHIDPSAIFPRLVDTLKSKNDSGELKKIVLIGKNANAGKEIEKPALAVSHGQVLERAGLPAPEIITDDLEVWSLKRHFKDSYDTYIDVKNKRVFIISDTEKTGVLEKALSPTFTKKGQGYYEGPGNPDKEVAKVKPVKAKPKVQVVIEQ